MKDVKQPWPFPRAARPAPTAPHVAYREGKQAFAEGKRLSSNPHKFAGVAFEMWAEGWRDAEFSDNQRGEE